LQLCVILPANPTIFSESRTIQQLHGLNRLLLSYISQNLSYKINAFDAIVAIQFIKTQLKLLGLKFTVSLWFARSKTAAKQLL